MKEALKAVFFDVGETLVDEGGWGREAARAAGISPQAFWAALGVTIARGEEHTALWEHLGVERPAAYEHLTYERADLFPDAIGCLEELRSAGLFVGIAGNQTAALEQWARTEELPADFIASSASWGVRKPAAEFFARIVEAAGCEPSQVAYVGDRVDNDVISAAAAGLVTVHVRRGPWGRLQDATSHAALQVDTLAELPAALASFR